jgi:hypothetical protein
MKTKLNYKTIKKDIKNAFYRIYEGKYGVYELEILNEFDGVIIYFRSNKLNLCGGQVFDKNEILKMNKLEFIRIINEVIYYQVNEPWID